MVISVLLVITAYDPVRQDAWISALITAVGGPLITWLIMTLAVQFPGETFMEYAPRLLGKVLGPIVSVLLLLFLMERGTFLLRTFAGMLTLSVYTQTPIIVFMVLTSLVVAVGVRHGIEVVGRLGDIFTPIYLVVTAVVLAASVPLWDTQWVRPIMARGVLPVIIGAVTPTAYFVEKLYLLILAPVVPDVKRARTVATWAAFAASVIMLLFAICVLFTFGPFEAPRFSLPGYYLARIASLGDLYERLDIIPLLAWSLTMVVHLSVIAYALTKGTGQLLGIRDHRSLAFPLASIGIPVAIMSVADFAQFREFVHPSIMGVYMLGLVFPVFLIILVVALIRKAPARPSARAKGGK